MRHWEEKLRKGEERWAEEMVGAEAEREEVLKEGGEEKVEGEEQRASGAEMEATAPEEKAEEDEEEDPMAHLNAMRPPPPPHRQERMAAMAQMAEISNMQAALAQRVQASMQRIHSIMEEPQPATPSAAHHDEAEEWRRKIALLSAPCVPLPQGGAAAAGGAEAQPAFLLADTTSSPRQSEARQADVAALESGGSSAAPQVFSPSPQVSSSPKVFSSSPQVSSSPKVFSSSPQVSSSPKVFSSSPQVSSSPKEFSSSGVLFPLTHVSSSPQMIPYSPLQRGHGSEPQDNHAGVAAREARLGQDTEPTAGRASARRCRR
ncbi:hypothetical protein AB1Y20_012123 [Prymnesium parvum]|uniref:Uncharacterized protein n=1 Tax=Prymnesium parvum TaxID=97485 RepID=A0AB34IR62_PRYPA